MFNHNDFLQHARAVYLRIFKGMYLNNIKSGAVNSENKIEHSKIATF